MTTVVLKGLHTDDSTVTARGRGVTEFLIQVWGFISGLASEGEDDRVSRKREGNSMRGQFYW